MTGQLPKMRERILQVSLRLFTDKGYDGTSLREISEELGVTKAALYYHFRTKQEILESLVASITEEFGELAEWAGSQPPGEATGEALLQRAADLAYGPASHVIEMVQQNQTAMREMQSGRPHQDPPIGMFLQIMASLAPPEASYEEKVRARVALFSVFASAFLSRDVDPEVADAERREVSLRIARGILAPA